MGTSPTGARTTAHSFSLRSGAPGDEVALALLGAATFLETYAGSVPGAAILEHCRIHHVREKYRVWLDSTDAYVCLAEVNGAPVGYAVLCPPDPLLPSVPGDIELRRIYLLHRFHGSGMGAALLKWSISLAENLGIRRMILGVYDGNAKALAFYARHGFRKIGERPFQVGDQQFVDPVLGRDLSLRSPIAAEPRPA